MYAPAFKLGKERFIFAYKDQMFETREQAAMRGKELVYWFNKGDNPIEYVEVVDVQALGARPVYTVRGLKVCLIDRPVIQEKKNERGRRKKRVV